MDRNKNYQRIDRLIINSFISLCKKEKEDNISVAKVCKEADINRTTFYNHYKDIWEIVEVIEGEIMKKIQLLFDDFSFTAFMKDPLPTLSRLNKIIEEKPEYYQRLYELSESRFFIDKLKDMFMENLLKDKDFQKTFNSKGNARNAASFIVGGLSNVYSDYLGRKLDCSLDSLIEGMSISIRKFGKALDID